MIVDYLGRVVGEPLLQQRFLVGGRHDPHRRAAPLPRQCDVGQLDEGPDDRAVPADLPAADLPQEPLRRAAPYAHDEYRREVLEPQVRLLQEAPACYASDDAPADAPAMPALEPLPARPAPDVVTDRPDGRTPGQGTVVVAGRSRPSGRAQPCDTQARDERSDAGPVLLLRRRRCAASGARHRDAGGVRRRSLGEPRAPRRRRRASRYTATRTSRSASCSRASRC